MRSGHTSFEHSSTGAMRRRGDPHGSIEQAVQRQHRIDRHCPPDGLRWLGRGRHERSRAGEAAVPARLLLPQTARSVRTSYSQFHPPSTHADSLTRACAILTFGPPGHGGRAVVPAGGWLVHFDQIQPAGPRCRSVGHRGATPTPLRSCRIAGVGLGAGAATCIGCWLVAIEPGG